jgi:hypothetical protein
MAFETSRLTVTSVTFVTQVQYDLASQINCAFAAFDLAKHLRVDQIGLVELEICCRTARIEPITKKTHTHKYDITCVQFIPTSRMSPAIIAKAQ